MAALWNINALGARVASCPPFLYGVSCLSYGCTGATLVLLRGWLTVTALVPFVLGGLFGLLAPMALAYLLLQTVFLVRPPPSDTQRSFFRESRIGSLALIPPMFFVGFVLFSAIGQGVSIDSVHLSSANKYVLWSLVLFGLLAQLLLGQRLSLVADPSTASGQRLVVERVVSGAIHSVARSDILSIGLYRTWINYRDRRIELHLKDGRAIRLFFGETVRAELTTWLDQSQ